MDIGTGEFLNRASAVFSDCTVTTGKEACFDSRYSNLGFLGDSTLKVWGDFSAGAWDEHTLSIHGSVVNHGFMSFNMRTNLSEAIDNKGTVEIYEDEDEDSRLDPSKVTGNAPKIVE